MINLILIAKAKAIESKSDEITVEHIKKAFNYTAIEWPYEQSLYREFDYDIDIENILCISKDVIKKAKKHPKLNYSDEVKKIFRELKLNSQVEVSSIIECETPLGSKLLRQVREVKTVLSEQLYGQDLAIESVVDAIKNNILPSKNKGPALTFLFLGPPATGKTYLAELLGDVLDEYENHVKVFDMTQFSYQDSGGALYGTSRQYGNGKTGELTSYVKQHPKSIIVLDEFEKAHNTVQTNLLSIFSRGKMKDTCGWCLKDGKEVPYSKNSTCSEDTVIDMVDFSETIFVITSNLGKELYSDIKFSKLLQTNPILAQTMYIDTLKRETKSSLHEIVPAVIPELLSRLSQAHITVFNKLSFQALNTIAKNTFLEYSLAFKKTYGINFTIDDGFDDFLKIQLLKYTPDIDARRLKSKLGEDFFDQITDYLIHQEEGASYDEIRYKISEKAALYFNMEVKPNIETKTLLKELFRKNLTLNVTSSLSVENQTMTYHIEDISFTKVERVSDYLGDTGLVFEVPEVSFDDIAGYKNIKTRLLEISHYLKSPNLLALYDIDVPKGMLLYGPPGTGKTLLAKAFANESDLPFLETTGTKLLDIEHIKSIFAKAKEYAPSVIFIDEIDAIGKRENGDGKDIFINQLLSEMNGFANSEEDTVFIIAATNYKDNIDSAILRPGRLGLHINVNYLDREARKFFIKKILEKPTIGEFDMDKLLSYTAGMTGAELEHLAQESALYVIRRKKEGISQETLIEQINIIKYGERLKDKKLQDELGSTAIHEAAHAIVSKLLIPEQKIEQITITPRDQSLGFVSYDREEVTANYSYQDIREKIAVALAGRIAQIKKYGIDEGLDSGASSDLKYATHLAYIAIAHYGMDNEIGYINIEGIDRNNMWQDLIEDKVRVWIDEEMQKTTKLIEKNWDKVEKLSELLLKEEVLDDASVISIMKD